MCAEIRELQQGQGFLTSDGRSLTVNKLIIFVADFLNKH